MIEKSAKGSIFYLEIWKLPKSQTNMPVKKLKNLSKFILTLADQSIDF